MMSVDQHLPVNEPELIAHGWDFTPSEAIDLQCMLSGQVICQDQLPVVNVVAGVDVGFEDSGRITTAAVAVLKFPELDLIDYAIARLPTVMPYIPGLLSFRECPAIIKALENLTIRPDLLLCDGQGVAHPRGLGVATHLGLVTGLPAIGVAKSRLCGRHEDVPVVKGAKAPLIHKEKVIGTVLRSRENCRPLYVSIGHKISLETSVHYVQACLTRYRLPETTRWADALASNRGNALARAEHLRSLAIS